MNRTLKAFILALVIHAFIAVAFVSTNKSKKLAYHNPKDKQSKMISLSHIMIKKPPLIRQHKVPKTIEKKKKQKKKTFKKKKIVKKKKRAKKRVVKTKEVKKIKQSLVEDLSRSYLQVNKSKIYKAIQDAKSYPRMAKKLHLQGRVFVTFTLTSAGRVENIKTSGAHMILEKSAIKTIKKASRFFPKPKQNININFPMEYMLR